MQETAVQASQNPLELGRVQPVVRLILHVVLFFPALAKAAITRL